MIFIIASAVEQGEESGVLITVALLKKKIWEKYIFLKERNLS